MAFEERAELLRLASRIRTERNPEIFGKLIAELNELLVYTEEPIRPQPSSPSECDQQKRRIAVSSNYKTVEVT